MSGKLNYPKSIDPCSAAAGRTIFDGPGQMVECDPATIKLLSDRVLIQDLPQDDSIRGSLVIPEIAQNGGVGKNGSFRLGLVIATGPGDAYHETLAGNHGEVSRKLITKPCMHEGYDMRHHLEPSCPMCDENGRIPVVVPPQCKPGDIVLFDRRRHEELVINGQLYQLCHAEQAVLAIIDV